MPTNAYKIAYLPTLPTAYLETQDALELSFYVTTYQNDNYKFYACNVAFDIREKMKEIDDCLL